MESLPSAAPIADAVQDASSTNTRPSNSQKIDDHISVAAGTTATVPDKSIKGKAIIDVFDDVEDQDLYDDDDDDDNNDDDDGDGYDDNDDYMDYIYEDDSGDYNKLQAQFDNMKDVPPGVEASVTWLPDSSSSKAENKSEEEEEEEEDWKYSKLPTLKDKTGRVITVIDPENVGVVETMCGYEHFRRFDVVDDYSDHHYAESKFTPAKHWAKRIQEEWKILEKDLPETIFVRVYEDRMDLLRTVILGAQGTPYHDGLFFFDVIFPSTYADTPPQVYYQSHGLRLNPNLYKNGYVCLSLLNTWQGQAEQKWQPKLSTMLQVLVSIQGLVLNADPYFNEPGYESSRGTPNGKKQSDIYTENTFMLSLKTMSYNMRNPPKHFEQFVGGHFLTHAEYILEKCRGYLDGARVGSVKAGGGEQDRAEGGCSVSFKQSLYMYLKYLGEDFRNIGLKGVDKFLPAGMNKKEQEESSSS